MRWKVIGIGNPYRRDDGAGRQVAETLGEVEALDVAIVGGESSELLLAWSGCSRVVVVDAMASGAQPGSVICRDALREPLPQPVGNSSTHGLGLAAAVALAEALGELPQQLYFIGIEGADFSIGEGLTPAVNTATQQVVEGLRSLADPADRSVTDPLADLNRLVVDARKSPPLTTRPRMTQSHKRGNRHA